MEIAIKTEEQYNTLTKRMEQLLKVVTNKTPINDPNFIELDFISELIADYEEVHFAIPIPSLTDVILLKMEEMNLTQKKLSELLSISTSRVSEYLSGKSEPTLKIARRISKVLNIDPVIVLGV